MKPMTLNLSKMKKVGSDQSSSTFLHPDGHKMVIAHHAVSALQRKQLEKMPVQKMAAGGDTLPPELADIPQEAPAEPDPSLANRLGSDVRQGVSDAVGAFRKVGEWGGDLASPVNNFAKGLVGEPSANAEVTPTTNDEIPSQQSAAVPGDGAPRMPPALPSPLDAPTADVGAAYKQGQQAITEQQKIDSTKADANLGVQQKDLAQREALNQSFQDLQKEFVSHQQQFLRDYANNHVDPKHYQENMSTGSKISTGIGLLLGGMSAATTGGQNPAMEFLNKQIDRDIKSQESRIDQQKTILGANQEIYHDQALAMNQTRVNMNDIYDHKIQVEAAKLGTPQAKANADAAHSKFALENAQLLQQNAMRAAALKGASQGALDPARMVPFLVEKEHQAKVFGEIEAAENTRKMATTINQAFEEAAKENTVLRTGAGLLRTPGSVMALHQAMQPTFKDLEGTVRQAAMDNTFKNITPMPGDTDHKIQQKRAAKDEYLKSKMSAPIARGYGIDLSRYQTTAPLPSSGSNSDEGKTASDSRGNRVVMKNGRWVPLGR